MNKKILIADDHTIVSRGLLYLINMHFDAYNIDEVSSLKDLFKALEANDYDFLILDINLSDGSSVEHIPGIISKYPLLSILVHSMMAEEVYAKKLMQMGISGFLKKNSTEKETIEALDAFLSGEKYMSRSLKESFFNGKGSNDENIFNRLSITELKVLGLFLKGHRLKEIAAELNVAQQTIATYKARAFKKLGTENVFEIKRLSEIYNVNFD